MGALFIKKRKFPFLFFEFSGGEFWANHSDRSASRRAAGGIYIQGVSVQGQIPQNL
jgi:hypothetical protein